jgi:hypothetical protein
LATAERRAREIHVSAGMMASAVATRLNMKSKAAILAALRNLITTATDIP